MEKKLGLSALTALVLSSMLGAGVFSLPQNMAAVASPAALLIGWAITGVGILLLAFAMLILTRIRSELDGGIFTYISEENAAPLHFSHPSGSVADGHGTGTPTGSAEPSPKPTFLCRSYDVIKCNITRTS
ncbi:amino acid permease [Salmonella enterica subsp. enterica serovar Typhi]|nr:amino acid permease [Salmonella enterica subsp. enterica serovar Typhi]